MSNPRLVRRFCTAIVGGFLAGILATALVRRWRTMAARRSIESSRQEAEITLLEVSS